MAADGFAHFGVVATQEHVALQFSSKWKRHAGATVGEPVDARTERWIVGFNHFGKAEIRTGVFVRAEHACRPGHARDPLQRGMQVGGFAFEHAPASAAKEGVADENRIRDAISKMRPRVSGNMPDRDFRKSFDANDIAVCARLRDHRHARVIRTEDRARGVRTQCRCAADVVGMMVREQEGGEFESKRLQRIGDHLGIAGIDRDGPPTGLQQPQIVVREGGQGMHGQVGDLGGGKDRHRMQFFRMQPGLYHNRVPANPSGVMPLTRETPIDASPRWWPRLQAAERRALIGTPAADERELWIAAQPAETVPRSGVLDLVADVRQLQGDFRAAVDRWPLREDSIDRVVLQHALEVVGDAEALLDEALRVLKPERSIVLVIVGALGWTRCRLHFGDSGAPILRLHSTRTLLEALAARGCVDLRVSRIDFDGRDDARVAAPARMWSGLCVIEARKRRELPNVRHLRARSRVVAPASGWIARPTPRSGLAA